MIQYYKNTAFSYVWKIRSSCGQFLELANCRAFCVWRKSPDDANVELKLPCVFNLDRSLAALVDEILPLPAGNYYLQCVLVDDGKTPFIVDAVQFTVLTCPEVL